MVHLYLNRRMTLGFFQKMRKAFENQYLETSMRDCIYKCWGFKTQGGNKIQKEGLEATGGPT
jgi:hypothetical protein